jgi:hypothetical protein
MTGPLVIPAVIAALALLLFFYALTVRKHPWIAGAILLIPALGAPAAISQTLGWSMPIEWELLMGEQEIELVGPPYLREGEAIYLWTLSNGTPKCFQAPWSLETAKQLYDAQSQAEADGTGVIIEGLFDASDGEFMAHPRPIEALPPKQESAPW